MTDKQPRCPRGSPQIPHTCSWGTWDPPALDDAEVRPGPKWGWEPSREAAQDASGGPTAPVEAPGRLICHCAVLLPALRRWVAAIDEVDAPGGGLAECDEYADAAVALEALARAASRG